MKIGGHRANGTRQRRPEMISAREVTYRKDRNDPASIYEAIALKFEPRLSAAILSALNAQADSVDLDLLAAAIEAGDVSRVVALLDIDPAIVALGSATPVVQQATYAGGIAAAATITAWRPTGLSFAFNTLNPRLLTWLQTYNLGLIRQINDGTKEGVRQYLLTGMEAGKNPKAVAREIKDIIGLTDRQAQAVKNYRRQLEEFHTRRSAAGFNLGAKIDRVNGTQVFRPDADGKPKDGIKERRLRDFRHDGQLRRAMETGKPLKPEQVDKMVAAYARKYRAYRARTIARTEAIRTTNVGVQEAWHQAMDAGVVPEDLTRKKWIVARDERLCEVCGPIPKMNPKLGVKHGQPFKTPDGMVNLPPIHPNCRCTVFYRVYEPSQIADAEGAG
jgi:hypothetical protein